MFQFRPSDRWTWQPSKHAILAQCWLNENGLVLLGPLNIRFMAPEFVGRHDEYRFYMTSIVLKWRSLSPGLPPSELGGDPGAAVRAACLGNLRSRVRTTLWP